MQNLDENNLMAKVILFSGLTAVAVSIWMEVLGLEIAVFITFIITGYLIRRWVYGKR